MRYNLAAALGVAVLVLGMNAHAHAQCAFEHPKKTPKFQVSLVPAFIGCDDSFCIGGGNSSNTTAFGGNIPACRPPETYNEQAGFPINGWLWGPKSQVLLQLKSLKQVADLTVTPGDPDASDVLITVKASDVEYAPGDGSAWVTDATGTLEIAVRLTTNDRTSQDVTAKVVAFNLPFQVVAGRAETKASLDHLLNAGQSPSLPHCTLFQIVNIGMLDEVSHQFAVQGLFMP
jgi:hypothetical protein